MRTGSGVFLNVLRWIIAAFILHSRKRDDENLVMIPVEP